MNTYEYGVYNKYVRDALRETDGIAPAFLSAEWENIHYFEITASTEEMARKKAEAKHSPVTGYIIDYIKKI
jgi:hypothetical protein|tara:strand:- start:237 stop:449 length:213 start_codon:yes stop_codon:yes gene_type:complete